MTEFDSLAQPETAAEHAGADASPLLEMPDLQDLEFLLDEIEDQIAPLA